MVKWSAMSSRDAPLQNSAQDGANFAPPTWLEPLAEENNGQYKYVDISEPAK